jgi:hypothetical protein
MVTQGHETPACRMLLFKRDDTGADMWFRLPNTGVEDSIMAVSLTAIATGYKSQLNYNPNLTSGCGSEPKILYLSIVAPGG